MVIAAIVAFVQASPRETEIKLAVFSLIVRHFNNPNSIFSFRIVVFLLFRFFRSEKEKERERTHCTSYEISLIIQRISVVWDESSIKDFHWNERDWIRLNTICAKCHAWDGEEIIRAGAFVANNSKSKAILKLLYEERSWWKWCNIFQDHERELSIFNLRKGIFFSKLFINLINFHFLFWMKNLFQNVFLFPFNY